MSTLDKMIEKHGAPLLGMVACRYDPVYVEIVASLGFHALWIEMEHAAITFREAEDLCRLASSLGLLTLLRIPDARRDSVLKAVESGTDILDLPMANSPQVLQELVKHARYSPEGDRGFFSSSRAMRYGLVSDIVKQRRNVNEQLCLMAQIETPEALEHIEEICQVPGIDALFMGTGDFSAAFGMPGQRDNPVVQEAVNRVIATAKRYGKRIVLPSDPAEAGQWAQKGVDLLFLRNDVACLRLAAKSALDEAQASLRALAHDTR